MDKFGFVEQIESALLDSVGFPKSYKTLDIPIESIQEKLAKALDFKELTFDLKDPKIEKNNLFLDACQCLELQTPLDGTLLFALSNDDFKQLLEIFSKQVIETIDPYLAKAVFYYLTLEIVKTLKDVGFLVDLELKINPIDSIPNPPLFSNFLDLKLGDKTLNFKIVYTKSFAKSFHTYVEPKLGSTLPKKGLEDVDILLRMQIGSTELDFETLKKVKKGDFVLLDRCTIDPETNHGTCHLSLGNKPLFIAKLKEDEIKILDLVKLAGEDMIDDENEISPEDDSWLENEVNEAPIENEVEEKAEEPSEAPLNATVETSKEKLVKPSDIPLTLTAEVARLKLTAKELLEIAPNTTLDLKVDLDEGIDLVVQGKKIAKGELVKLGNFLGVRITEIKK